MIEREIEDVVGGNVDEDTDMEEDDLHHHHHQDIYGIIRGIGLADPVRKGVQVSGMEIGVVNIQDQDQMIVGSQMIVMVAVIKKIYVYCIKCFVNR